VEAQVGNGSPVYTPFNLLRFATHFANFGTVFQDRTIGNFAAIDTNRPRRPRFVIYRGNETGSSREAEYCYSECGVHLGCCCLPLQFSPVISPLLKSFYVMRQGSLRFWDFSGPSVHALAPLWIATFGSFHKWRVPAVVWCASAISVFMLPAYSEREKCH
jgi:hypothetical protein